MIFHDSLNVIGQCFINGRSLYGQSHASRHIELEKTCYIDYQVNRRSGFASIIKKTKHVVILIFMGQRSQINPNLPLGSIVFLCFMNTHHCKLMLDATS